MILLLGGTNETASVARKLAEAGYEVLVSLATDIPLCVGSHPNITERRGRLNAEEMTTLIRRHGTRAVVDITHPYASQARETARSAAARLGIPYFTYVRPAVVTSEDGVCAASDHQAAARIACEYGMPVLLTIGSKNVPIYAAEARRKGVPLIARVLSDEASVRACMEAGIPAAHIVAGRGPFDMEQNRELIRRFGIGVLVTKDSGQAGGVREKIEAARLEQCIVVVVARPACHENSFASVPALVQEVQQRLPRRVPVLALDLESVLIPEIWETVARVTGIGELAVTTRDIADYDCLMRQRIKLCRQHGLTLARLRDIVATIEPFPGALDFLHWAQAFSQTVIVSDTFYELASPVLAKLGCALNLCNWLVTDEDGYLRDYRVRHPDRKLAAIAQFQRLGFRVLAIGDSYNDVTMLESATAGFLFRPAQRVVESHSEFPVLSSYAELQETLQKTNRELI